MDLFKFLKKKEMVSSLEEISNKIVLPSKKIPSEIVLSSGEFYDEMAQRIEGLTPEGISNCIGTALYLVGEKSRDEYLYGLKSETIISKLSEVSNPDLGFLIGWHDGHWTYHLGVITHLEPLLITNRYGVEGLIIKNEPFESVDKKYSPLKKSLRYYIPSKLEEFLARFR